MVYDLKDKIVFITGGAGGIGAKLVECMLEEDVKHVAFLDILEDKGLLLQEELRGRFGECKVSFYKCNALEENQLLETIKLVKDKFGYIDIFINNAGIWNDSQEFYRKAIQLNFTTLVTCTMKAIEWMRKDKGGRGGAVVNVSSISALSQMTYAPIYSATKIAILQFSNCVGLPEYYDKYGVRVITICFGITDTTLSTAKIIRTFDSDIENSLNELLNTAYLQKPESAARAVVGVCKNGESGSTWLSNNDERLKDISAEVKKAFEILSSTYQIKFK